MVNECEYKVVRATILLAILLLQRRGLPQNWDNIETFEPSFTPIQFTMRRYNVFCLCSLLCECVFFFVFCFPFLPFISFSLLNSFSHFFFSSYIAIVLGDMYSIFLLYIRIFLDSLLWWNEFPGLKHWMCIISSHVKWNSCIYSWDSENNNILESNETQLSSFLLYFSINYNLIFHF